MAKKILYFETPHRHLIRIAQSLKKAEQLCQQGGVKLTPLRRKVLELIWQSYKPLGAYALLEHLSRFHGKPVAPPTVYRALSFLLERGLIHKIVSLNAFTGCLYPESPHVGQFLICAQCGDTAELHVSHLHPDLRKHAQRLGFQVDQTVIELIGRCSVCQRPQEISYG